MKHTLLRPCLLVLALCAGLSAAWAQPLCDNDTTPPTAACDGLIEREAHPTNGLVLSAHDVDEGSFDLCSNVILRIELEANSTGQPPTDSVLLLPPAVANYVVALWVGDAAGNWTVCWADVSVTGFYHALTGSLYTDTNANCTLDAPEAGSGFAGWTVRASSAALGRTWETLTDPTGQYTIPLSSTVASGLTDLQVEVLLPGGLATGCASSYLVGAPTGDITTVDFAAGLFTACTYLTVDVATPLLRRCFDNNLQVRYTNYANQLASDATVEITLDPLLALVGASVPYTDLGGGVYRCELGDLPAGASGQFSVQVHVSCEAELGATHCVEALITPFTCGQGGSFANLRVSGLCDETLGEVRFTVTNEGNAPLTQPRTLRIVEDVVMYMQQPLPSLGVGASETWVVEANGATWRLEVDQDPANPFGGLAAAFVEGCGGFTPGQATPFSLAFNKPNEDRLCLQNIGAYDPNDKQALPRGAGSAHYLPPNTPLEYLIRFQNTGTDTAFNVRIDDQLSPYLNPQMLRPGASSHPYRMELTTDGLLRLHFNQIMLPDSQVNAAASQGFVQFWIHQQPNLPDGVVIENTAAIYFDFNEPVVTNTVFHTIGQPFVVLSTEPSLPSSPGLQVAPNPLVHERVTFQLTGPAPQSGQWACYDALGRMVAQGPFDHQQFSLDRHQLGDPGMYVIRIFTGHTPLLSAKLLVK